MSAAISSPADIPANARYTMQIISRHRHGMNARAKVAKLQAEAPANVCYEHIVDQDGRVMIHHVYRYTVIEPKHTKTTPAAEVPALPTAPRFVVNQLGFRYYAVRDTKLGRNVRTMCGDRDAEQQAIDAAAELNATDK